MKKKMKFPDGSVVEVDEADVATARSLGAVDFTEAPAPKKAGQKTFMQFPDGQTKEIELADVGVAESLGAVKKKETSASGAATGLPQSSLRSMLSVDRTISGQPEVSRNPYAGVIEATKDAPVEKRTSIYNEAVAKKNLQPLVDFVNEEKDSLKKRKDEFRASEPTEADLTGVTDLLLATDVDRTEDTFKADDDRINVIQKAAANAIDAVMADKFLEKKGADKLLAAKDLGKERRAMRSAIGEEVGFQDELGELDYIQKNLSNKEDAFLKLSGAVSVNVKENQQMHDYKNEFGIYASSLAKLENDLNDLYDGNENVRKFYQTSTNKEPVVSNEEYNQLLRDPAVTEFRQKFSTYDLLGERLKQLPQSYPYVAWELKRSKIADKWAEIVHAENEISDITPGQRELRRLRQLFVGDKPNTDSEIKTLSSETGIPEDQVKEIIDTYGSDVGGIAVPSTLGKVLRGGTNIVNSTVQGLARDFVDHDKANLINKQLNKVNYNIPEAVRKDWSVDKVIDVMANGLGQFAGFVTVARLGGAPLEAAGLATEIPSVVNAISKANSIGSTFATGYLASLEDAYKYAATQSDDEGERMKYAQSIAAANGASELILRDVDVANKILKGKPAAKILDDFAATKTPFTSGDVFKARVGDFAKVLGYESAEELVPYFTEVFQKDNIFGNKTSTAEIFKGALDTVIETAISTIPMGGFSATSTPTTKIMEAALLESAKTPEKFNNRWEEMYERGSISNEIKNRNIQTVNTLADIYSKLPDNIPGVSELNEEQKASLVHDIFAKRQLENLKNAIDPSLTGKIDERLAVIDNKINEVINPAPAAETSQPALLTPEEVEIKVTETIPEDKRTDAISFVNEMAQGELIPDTFREAAVANPLTFLQTVADQALGYTRDSEGNRVKSTDAIDPNVASQYSETVVDYAKELFHNTPIKTVYELQESGRTTDNVDGEHEVSTYRIKSGKDDLGGIELHEYKDKGYMFSAIHIPENLRGKGFGKQLYRDVNEKSTKETGFPLWAKKNLLNENSERVWKSLINSGEAESVGDIYRFKQTMQDTSELQKSPVQTFADRVIAGEQMNEVDREFYDQNAAEVDAEVQSRNPRIRVSAERMESLQPPKPPISEPPKSSGVFVERPATELSYRGLQNVANEFSLPDVERRDPKTDLELFRNAQTRVNDWASKGEYVKNVEALVQKAENGGILTDEERVILEQHLANLSNELRAMTNVKSQEYDAKLAEILRLKNAGERTRGEAGAALRIPTFNARPKTIVDAMVEEMDVNNVTVLTDAQKEKVQKEWDALEKAKNDFNAYVFQKEAELSAKSAQAKFEEERKATATVKKPKKSKEEFGAEVDDILKSIRDKWKKAGESDVLTAVPLPYAKQLVAIAPDVLKLMKAYAAQAGSKFVDFVDDIHSYLQQDIPEITKEDIVDIARGVYNEKKPTRNELAEKLQNWRTEAKLIDQLVKLESGEEPKTEAKKIKRNQEITALREQIKEHDLTKLADAKESLKKRIDKAQEQLDKGEYGPAEKKEPIELDKEGKELQDKLIKLQYERQLRLLIQQKKNSSRREKLIKAAADVLNIPRTLMTIGDFSAVLRQGIIPAISHPIMTFGLKKGDDGKIKLEGAFYKMFQAATSQKEYDRWFYNLQENPRYEIMRESDLAIADNLSHELAKREEDFMSSLAEKIPIIGQSLKIKGKTIIPGANIVKGSERAYTMFLNKMRVDLFNQFADSMEARGVTFRNNPEAYKQMADYVNNATGRGSLGYSLNKIAPLLNSLFFSPRLIASRLNMLTYLAQRRFWKKAPQEVRTAYFKDMAKFIGVGMTVLALSSLGGSDDDEVEIDPRSTDFGKIKRGNQRWDIWGGFQPYVRVAAQLLTGRRKSTSNDKLYELGPNKRFQDTYVGVATNFGRSKLSPIVGGVWDLASGENLIGEKIVYDGDAGKKEITIGQYIKEHMLPLTYTGTQEAMKDQGIQAIFTVGIPSAFGVGTQTHKN